MNPSDFFDTSGEDKILQDSLAFFGGIDDGFIFTVPFKSMGGGGDTFKAPLG